MEVSVAGSDGLPEGCIISIKAGTTRRQVHKDGTKPLRLWFPKPPASGAPLKVDVLSPYGSAVLDVDPAVEKYALDVNTTDGGDLVQLQLQVRESAQEHGERSKAVASDEKTDNGIASMQSYLDKHGVLTWTQDLIKDLLRDRPEELWPYVQQHMERAQQAELKQAVRKAPLDGEATASAAAAQPTGSRPRQAEEPKEEVNEDVAPPHVTLGLIGQAFMDHAHGPVAKPKLEQPKAPVMVDLRMALETALTSDVKVYEADKEVRTTAQEALAESLGIRAKQLGEAALADGLLSDAEIQEETKKLKQVAALALSRAFAVERGSLHDLRSPIVPLETEKRQTPKKQDETSGDLGLEQLRLRLKDTLSFAMKDHTLEDALKDMLEEEMQVGSQAAPAAVPYFKRPSVGTWQMSVPFPMDEDQAIASSWADTPSRIPPGDALNYAAESTDGFRVTDAFTKTAKPAAWMPHPGAHPSLGFGGAGVATASMTWNMRTSDGRIGLEGIEQVDDTIAGKYALQAALSGVESQEVSEVKRIARQGAEAVLTETTNEVRQAMQQALGVVEESAKEAKEVGKKALEACLTTATAEATPAAIGSRQDALPVGKGSRSLDEQELASAAQALQGAVLDDVELAMADREARDVARFALEMLFDLVPPATPGTRASAAAAMQSALCDDPATTAAVAASREVAALALDELPDQPLDDEEVKQAAKLALLAALDDTNLDNQRYEVGVLALQAMDTLRTAPGPEEEAKMAGKAALDAMFTEPEMRSPTEGLRILAREALEAAFAANLAGDQPARTNIHYGPYTFSAEPAVPRKPSRAGKAMAVGLANSPSIAELEARIRERNARFRRENEALRRDNLRLKQIQESSSTAVMLDLENAKLRKQLGNLVGQKEELRSNVRRAPAVA